MEEKTVAAISTPPGEGGISVIRISGAAAFEVADKVFKAFNGKPLSDLKGYSAAYGEIVLNGENIDDGVALVFRAPHSYTGEDVVEISVHGGVVVARNTLRAVYGAGAYPAGPGEFTKRAFLNGKTDLAKAESIMGIISAKSDAALKISRAAREGRVSKEIESVVEYLLKTAASIAAYSDYPDEDIEGLDTKTFKEMLLKCSDKLSRLLINYDAGKVLREGIDCCIAGKPNVGKSTLMNMLSGSERSIVTDIAGTTRDVVENRVQVGDIILNLADTAGIHETDDPVERAGVDRAVKKLSDAPLVLAVFDTSLPLDSDDIKLLERLDKSRTLIVLNKSDLEQRLDKTVFDGFETVFISAKNNSGNSELSKAVGRISGAAALSADDAVLISERQRSCVQRAFSAITDAVDALETGMTIDAVGVCLDDCLAALLELTGKRVTSEVTDEVFKRFCVGK